MIFQHSMADRHPLLRDPSWFGNSESFQTRESFRAASFEMSGHKYQRFSASKLEQSLARHRFSKIFSKDSNFDFSCSFIENVS